MWLVWVMGGLVEGGLLDTAARIEQVGQSKIILRSVKFQISKSTSCRLLEIV